MVAELTAELDAQALTLKSEQLAEAIVGAGLELEAVIAALPEKADFDGWTKTLSDIDTKMRRLEPVNLAAIQEYGEQSERKNYLDAQNADLVSALETLEGAIKKIDRETRGRFKETFDRVNAGVQELSPRLFGGGHAYLELTGEDLLLHTPTENMTRLRGRPTLVIHAAHDPFVPAQHAHDLATAGQGAMWITPGTRHLSSFDIAGREYLNLVGNFFATHLSAEDCQPVHLEHLLVGVA